MSKSSPKSSKSCIVEVPAELLAYLFTAFPKEKKKQVRTWLKHGAVTVNGRPVTQFDHALRPRDVVAVESDRRVVEARAAGPGVEILFEDADLIVVEKPPNLLSIATEAERERTLYHQLTEALRERRPRTRERIWIVHRLDRETSGLMVFAKTVQAKRALQKGWDGAEKRYQAVVEGSMEKDAGTFDSHLDESNPFRVFSARASAATRHAVTHFRVLARGGGLTRVELVLETGRRHQIRVHLADAGHPVVGDAKYGAKGEATKRLALHACGLKFPHPSSRALLEFDSPLPPELARLVPRKRR